MHVKTTTNTSQFGFFSHFNAHYGLLQHVEIPMAERPHPNVSLQTSPRGSPLAPPSQRSSQRKTPPSHLNRLTHDNKHLCGGINQDREGKKKTMEHECGSIVYAALNHQPLARAASRPQKPKEERSEYAAIRIKTTRH